GSQSAVCIRSRRRQRCDSGRNLRNLCWLDVDLIRLDHETAHGNDIVRSDRCFEPHGRYITFLNFGSYMTQLTDFAQYGGKVFGLDTAQADLESTVARRNVIGT